MKKLLLSLAIIVSFVSCDDYLNAPNEEYSNNPLSANISPAQKLAASMKALLDNEIIYYNNYGNKMTYAYALNSGFTTSDVAYSFNYSSDSYTTLFENSYIYTANFQDIISTENLFPNYSDHLAIAKIMKAQGMEKIINLYGDAPYSLAFDASNTTPSYDDDLEVYKKLLLLLDEARNQIANPATNVVTVQSSQDIMFGGNMSMWTTYANTLELRMLLKLSNTTNPALIALRTNRFAALANDFVTADVSYNPGFTGATALQSNPMFRQFGTNVAQTQWLSGNRANAAGDFIAQVLNGTLNTTDLVTTGVVDPRRSRMFNLVGGIVTGATQGLETTVTKSRLGSFVHGYVGPSAYENGTERDAYIMLAAESYFLQAEAVERGYMPGSALTLFEQGIDASFDFYGRPFGDAPYTAISSTTYKSAINTKAGLGYAGGNPIAAIMTQKWLALAQWTGIEPYFDMLRTGYPKSPLPAGVSQTMRPRRLIYPTSEYSSNSANTPTVLSTDLFSINSKTQFYLQ